MKKHLVICLTFILSSLSLTSIAETGVPLKYISSCEIDLNGDKENDIALLVETSRSRELIVLMKTTNGYNAFVVSKGKPNMYLSCHFGKTVTETSAGKGKRTVQTHKTPGTYIQLTQPEGSSVVYFWNGKDFTEVWTAD